MPIVLHIILYLIGMREMLPFHSLVNIIKEAVMSQHYERIMIAVDGSYESELAFEKGVNVALRNKAELILTHVPYKALRPLTLTSTNN